METFNSIIALYSLWLCHYLKYDGMRKDLSLIHISDEEYMEMTGKIGAVFNEYIYNKPEEGRRPRRITFISSPCEEEQE